MTEWIDKPVLKYLSHLSDATLNTIYSSPACAFGVLRLLPDMAQLCILRIVYEYNSDCRIGDRKLWTSAENEHLIAKTVEQLTKLRIVEENEQKLMLNPVFRRSYLKALKIGLYRASKLIEYIDHEQKIKKFGNRDLEKRAIERWECILHYLALPSHTSEQGVSGTTKMLFKFASLTSSDSEGEFVEITSAGFQFLLLDRTEQIWTYIIHYLRMQEDAGVDVIIILDFFFRLTMCSDYTYVDSKNSSHDQSSDRAQHCRAFVIDETWPEAVKDFLMHLRELGIVFIRKRKDGYFFLTPLLNYLTTSFCAAELATEKRRKSGFLIVETNYRLYAYTDSSLQLAILSTFTEMLYRFNDMSVGILSRESVRRALQVGITASQIISYLRSNAHPTVANASANSNEFLECVPSTVIDQIRLWEDERCRLTLINSIIYSAFDSEAEYVELKNYATDKGIILWRDDLQRLIVVTEQGHSSVRQWWKTKAGPRETI